MKRNNWFAKAVLYWYGENGRSLPWRESRDPYDVMLSEAIMQQTRMEQGLPRWYAFKDRFPRVEDLARANDSEVMELWQGLGYYQRARNLLAAAREIDRRGDFPKTAKDLKQLKGIGDYAAADIAALAFDEAEPAIDGNAFRLMARCFGIHTPINTTEARTEFTLLGRELIPHDAPGDYNQGVMDLGALVCTPRQPHCCDCPLQSHCLALAEGCVGELPVKKKAKARKSLHLIYIYVLWEGQTAFRQRPATGLWQSLWEPWLVGEEELRKLNGRLTLVCKGLRHVLTHRDITADLYLLECGSRPTLPDGYQWMSPGEAERLPKSRLVEKLMSYIPIDFSHPF